jgi:hypothetical protein
LIMSTRCEIAPGAFIYAIRATILIRS